MRRVVDGVVYWLLSAALVASAAAQEYPTKAVRIVVAYTPSGTTDILARTIGQKLGERWNQPTFVENRPGAGGNIGTEFVARAAPDGHTLLMVTAGTHGINPGLYKQLNWDAVRDFAPISLVAIVPNILVVTNALPVRNVKELIEYARANPGALNYGSPGNGSTAHLSMELLKHLTGIRAGHVPYKGSAGVLTDVMGGQIGLALDNMPVYLPHVRAGKLRALAVSGARRASAAPDLPTIAEAAVSGFSAEAWFGLVAPVGTPRPIVDALSAETRRILSLPDVAQRISALGADIVGSTPEAFGMHIATEIEKWAKVIRDANVERQ